MKISIIQLGLDKFMCNIDCTTSTTRLEHQEMTSMVAVKTPNKFGPVDDGITSNKFGYESFE